MDQSHIRSKQLIVQAHKDLPQVFTDLDLTACQEGNQSFAAENIREHNLGNCFVAPDTLSALSDLQAVSPDAVTIVTGRHWADKRIDDVTGEKHPDGALHDLIGGEASPLAKCNAVAGHGRIIVKDGKQTILRRSDNPKQTLAEQKFETYIGRGLLNIKEEAFKKWPDMRGEILGEKKKHLSYFNIADYMKKEPAKGQEAFDFIDEQMIRLFEGKKPDGSDNPAAPENPGNAYIYTVEPTGSMEVRSKHQSKRHGLEKSGFIEEALKKDGPVLVAGDSLGKNGTDRDMFEAMNEAFTKAGQRNRLFLVHVANGADSPEKGDPCHPDIIASSPEGLGNLLKMLPIDKHQQDKTTLAALKQQQNFQR